MRSRTKLALAVLATALVPTGYALAKRVISPRDLGPPTFELSGRPIGGATPAAATPAYLTASRIAAAGDGALVSDADSGSLLRTDKAGTQVAALAIGADAGLLAYDPVARLAYVADRTGDRIVVVEVGVGRTDKLSAVRTIRTPAEPYAVALTPDRKTVLVSAIADRALVAYDAASGVERWRAGLDREPRGLAVSSDGARALVSYLVSGAVDQIDLVETHRAEHIALSTAIGRVRMARRCPRCTSDGDSFARASFAVTFMGAHQAVVPFQREVPVQQIDGGERTSSYGGGFEPPVTQQVAFIGLGKDVPVQAVAEISQHQPRALAWDGARDALYILGLGSDSILQVRNASQVGITEGWTAALTTGKDRCGPDGVALAGDGDVLVWCSFTRSVARLDVVDAKGELASAATVTGGPTLIASRLTAPQHQGMVIFHASDPATSQRGSLACSTCHPDHRADGLSWRIEKHALQTPVLAGRVVGTHPFKWDGGDKTLRDSMTSTMKRLGGFGIDTARTDALMSYIENLRPIRTPARDARAVARGKQLFESAELGCRSCHDGASYTDNQSHRFTGTLTESDTPSLLGLASSAPYYHDGSAATLEALLRDRGAVHGMLAESTRLSDTQVADLTAFLETL